MYVCEVRAVLENRFSCKWCVACGSVTYGVLCGNCVCFFTVRWGDIVGKSVALWGGVLVAVFEQFGLWFVMQT